MVDENVFVVFSFVLISVITSGLLSIPIIYLLYRFKIVRLIEVDFSTLIENRKKKLGTPIMGGLIFIIPIVIINIIFNLNPAVNIPIIIFIIAAILGGMDDFLNIYGHKRKFRSLHRIFKLMKVHKSTLYRIRLFVLSPWYFYRSLVNNFQSNPGKGLMAHEKLFVQITLGILLGYWILATQGGYLWLPLIGTFNIGFFIIPFAVIALLGMTNAVNFTDGMDGLSAGIILINYVGFMFLAILLSKWDIAILAATTVGGILTYLYYNIPPARIQMGDIGSFSLGSLLTAIAFAIGKPMLLPIIGFPFVVEILSTIVQSTVRKVFGRRILKMAPLHHHFEMIGWSEEKVVMRFWIFSIFCTLLGIWVFFL